jgi:hypothetical protein
VAINGERAPDMRFLLLETGRSGVEFQFSRIIANYGRFGVVETAFRTGLYFQG